MDLPNNRYRGKVKFVPCNNSANVGESSQLGKHGFSSLQALLGHTVTMTVLLRNLPRFTNEFD